MGNSERATHFGIVGTSGKGKTVTAAIIANQIENFIFVDPKNQFKDALNFLGEKKSWKFLKLSDSLKSKRQLRINTRDIGIFGFRALFYRKPTSGERTVIPSLRAFFGLSSRNVNKNFRNLKEIFVEHSKAEHLWEELNIILHPEDNGYSMEELQRGRWCIDVSQFDPDNRALGLFLASLIDFRKEKDFWRKNKLGIAIDEMDTFGKSDNASGKAMGFVFAFGRSFRISGMVIGTTEGDLHKLIKNNMTIQVLFQNPQEREKILKKYGVSLDEEVYKGLMQRYGEFGNCFLKAEAFGYVEPIAIHVNNFYQLVKENQGKNLEYFSFHDFADEYLLRNALSNSF